MSRYADLSGHDHEHTHDHAHEHAETEEELAGDELVLSPPRAEVGLFGVWLRWGAGLIAAGGFLLVIVDIYRLRQPLRRTVLPRSSESGARKRD